MSLRQEHFFTLKRVLDRLSNGEVNRQRCQLFSVRAWKTYECVPFFKATGLLVLGLSS